MTMINLPDKNFSPLQLKIKNRAGQYCNMLTEVSGFSVDSLSGHKL